MHPGVFHAREHAEVNVEMWDNGSNMQAEHHFNCFFFFYGFIFRSRGSFEARPLISLPALSFDTCWKKLSPTIDQNRGGGAFAASDDVFGHTRVVARVRQPGFFDDEIMVSRDEKIGVARRVENILVPLPLHLKNMF